VDVGDFPAGAVLAAAYWVTEIPCPHCGEKHLWSSGQMGRAVEALRDFPKASRVLVEADSATALP
jgi:hypothetical protein